MPQGHQNINHITLTLEFKDSILKLYISILDFFKLNATKLNLS